MTSATAEELARPQDPVLSAREITVRFGGVAALDAVSLDIARGALTGVVGPNGAGKTTLFAVLSGLLRPTNGQVFLSGQNVTGLGPHVRARRGIARTFQRVELFSSLSVRDHLTLARRLRIRHQAKWGPGVSQRDESVDDLLEGLGLTAVADVEAVTLPLGTARLVEVGRALATQPEVVLLDEPCSGLDAEQQRRLVDVLLDCQKLFRVSLVLVEHNVDLVLQISNYIYVLDTGRLIAAGTPGDIARDPVVHAAYLGADFVAST